MKIGIGSTKLEPSISHGRIDGIGVYVQNLLQQYNKLGLNVLPISFPPAQNPWRKTRLHQSMHFTAPYSLTTIAALTPFGSIFNASLEKKIDLFHATDYLIPRFKKIPVVGTLHDAIMLKHPEWCNPRFRKLKNFLIKHSLQWTDHIIAISKAMIPDLVNYWGADENKISVVHQSIPDIWLEKISVEEKKSVLDRFKLQQPFLLSVGTLQPRKNFLRIIQAYKALPETIQKNYKLVLVGKDGWQSTEIRQAIMQITAEKKALWLEYVTQDELRALYQSAQLLLFPSLSEGFGLPVLEAFASRIPVITSNTTSLPEIAGDAAYFVDPDQTEDIRQSIITLIENPGLCENLVNLGDKRVQEFTLEKCAQKTLDVYRKMK